MSDMTDLQSLYQELILDHGTCPRNYGCLSGTATGQAEGINPLCGDKITIYLRLENDQVKAIQFEGRGCAISVASASLMTELFQDKTIGEVKNLWGSFKKILGTEPDPRQLEVAAEISIVEAQDKLGKVLALTGVKAFPARVKCATLAWHAALAALKADQTGAAQMSSVSTE